ncbi:MAG: GumC family protein [Myxococcota bacterium]
MIDDGYDADYGRPQSFDPVAHGLRLVRDPMGVLRRRWPWMLLMVLLGLAGTGAFVATLEPTYVAHARVLISGQQIPEDFVRSTVRESSLENINAMVGQILSQQNLSSLIEHHALFEEEGEKQSRNALIGQMRANVDIRRDQIVSSGRDRSQIYAVSFEHGDPVKAAAVANDLASFFVEASIERRSRQAKVTTEFLTRELKRAESELREINREIAEYRRAHRGELPGDLAPSLAKLERLSAQRQALTLEISEREDRLLILTGVKDEAAASEVEEQLQQLRRQLTTELSVNTEQHPNVVSLRDRIARLESMVAGETPTEGRTNSLREMRIANEEAELTRLRQQVALVSQQIEATDARVDRIPGNEDALNALLERAAVLRENYLEFLRKVQDAELAESLESTQQGPRVSVLDRAQVPGSPTRPPLVFLVMGVVASLGAGVAAGFGFELLDPVVLDGDQLEGLSGEACLGSIPLL